MTKFCRSKATTPQDFLEIVEILEAIRDADPEDLEKVGICCNFESTFGDGRFYDSVLKESYDSWPHYSGSDTFPVPASYVADDEDEGDAAREYYYIGPKWDKATEYGRMRYDLLDHMINYFKGKAQ
jgi:hypothetical protein